MPRQTLTIEVSWPNTYRDLQPRDSIVRVLREIRRSARDQLSSIDVSIQVYTHLSAVESDRGPST